MSHSKIIDMNDPINLRAKFVEVVANARLRGDLSDTEWQIIIDEVCK